MNSIPTLVLPCLLLACGGQVAGAADGGVPEGGAPEWGRSCLADDASAYVPPACSTPGPASDPVCTAWVQAFAPGSTGVCVNGTCAISQLIPPDCTAGSGGDAFCQAWAQGYAMGGAAASKCACPDGSGYRCSIGDCVYVKLSASWQNYCGDNSHFNQCASNELCIHAQGGDRCVSACAQK